jgi:hypothetical protein
MPAAVAEAQAGLAAQAAVIVGTVKTTTLAIMLNSPQKTMVMAV